MKGLLADLPTSLDSSEQGRSKFWSSSMDWIVLESYFARAWAPGRLDVAEHLEKPAPICSWW